MMEFSDHFSATADAYARYRPDYPSELIAALVAASPDTGRAWDCATGNGQVAAALVKAFGQVVATDASAAQLDHAVRHSRIFYVRSLAENSGLACSSVDLITVGQALHWFILLAFTRKFAASPGRRGCLPPGVTAYSGSRPRSTPCWTPSTTKRSPAGGRSSVVTSNRLTGRFLSPLIPFFFPLFIWSATGPAATSAVTCAPGRR